MADTTKITLSVQELEVVKDSSWVLTKRQIISKVGELLNQQVPVISQLFTAGTTRLPFEVLTSRPKISRGENYQQLPYVILDYPGFFSKADIFALRTMFWWGNFFSITLHLSGSYKILYQDTLTEWIALEKDPALYVCINSEPWDHHFEPDNYVPAISIERESLKEKLIANDFLKIAYKFDLKDWNQMPSFLTAGYAKIAKGLGA